MRLGGGGRADGFARSSRRPLNTGARSRPLSVTPAYSISASTTGSTQVAFGLLTGTARAVKSDTFPIVAFVEKLGARPRRVASLYIGRRVGDQFLYAGKAQSGYSEADAREVRERLDPFIRKTTALSVPVNKPKATWVEPVVEADEIAAE